MFLQEKLINLDINQFKMQEQTNNSQKREFFFRVVTTGNTNVGKSRVIYRFTTNRFHQVMRGPGFEFGIREIQVNQKLIKFQLWDIYGSERYFIFILFYKTNQNTELGSIKLTAIRFQAVTRSYYRYADGITLVYDITNRKSFLDIQKWYDVTQKYVKKGKPTYVLLGNKCDLENERQVTFEEGSELAATLGIAFFETSAKDGINVTEAYTHLALQMAHKVEAQENQPGKEK